MGNVCGRQASDLDRLEGQFGTKQCTYSPNDCATLASVVWRILRKGPASLHIAYAGTFTNNLRSHNTRFRAQPSTEISLDLNPNLRSQNKSTNSYVDARELADGQIRSLEFVQIDDERIVRGLGDALDDLSNNWILTIELDGTHSFTARPKLENGSLFLYIASHT